MSDVELFKESNQSLATAFAIRLDKLSDEFFQLAENHKMEIDRTYRLGAWDRIKRLDRLEDGEEFLSEEDLFLLREESKFYVAGTYVFSPQVTCELTGNQLQQMWDWHGAAYVERSIAFAICAYIRIIAGVATEDESIYLYGQMNQILTFISMQELAKAGPPDAALAISAHASKIGLLGAQKRHQPMRTLKDWTVANYQSGNWKSIPIAASALREEVLTHGKTINANLSGHNAVETIIKWLRASSSGQKDTSSGHTASASGLKT